MILRSVMQHVRDQNWFAVALDFLIVVVGVFIGIQVANWNDARQRDARSETARARLVDNIRDEIELMRLRTIYFEGVSDFGEYADTVLDGPPPDTDAARWQFLVALFQAGQAWPFGLHGQVYREMQSAGQLDLIGGPEIRSALSSYYDESAREIGITFGTIDPYRALIRRKMPWPLQQYIWTRCYDFDASQTGRETIEEYMPACPPPDDLDRVRQAATDLHASEELEEYLHGRLSELHVTLGFIRNVTRDGVALIDEVNRTGREDDEAPEGSE
ncbi:MAG: hypothetical protein R3323_02135 [Wenzhouxiangellaceae bacterium]|nr:hypothetical protein [Wenzhouxiangellaceae bacterium]